MATPNYPFLNVTEGMKFLVWNKGIIVPGYDPLVVRIDAYGNWMQYGLHGKEGEWGWEIDHVYPAAKGGTDAFDNLQPLWWLNNRKKGDTYPYFG